MAAEIIDFQALTEARDREIYRWCQIASMMKLFWYEHLRYANSTDELDAWVVEVLLPREKPIIPREVLSPEELSAIESQARAAIASTDYTPLRRAPDCSHRSSDPAQE